MTASPQSLVEALQRDRFSAANGIEVLEVREGFARAQMPVSEQHFNCVGLVHGGALFTLAATTFFAACNAAGQLAVGINMTISCLEPAKSGILYAEATQVSRSRKTATCTVRITDDGQRLVALFQGTAYIKGTPFPPETGS